MIVVRIVKTESAQNKIFLNESAGPRGHKKKTFVEVFIDSPPSLFWPVLFYLFEMASTSSDVWSNSSIFVPIKAFVAVAPRAPRGQEFTVLHAQPNFFSIFKFSKSDLPLPISVLFCNASDCRVVSALEQAMVEGRSITANLNLQDKDGVILSCRVSLNSGNNLSASSVFMSGEVSSRFTVITIRSAPGSSQAAAQSG